MSQSGGDESRVSLGTFADATSADEDKKNKAVELALQHHNQAAGQAAMRIAFFRVVIGKAQRTPLRSMLYDICASLQEGYYASNSHDGRFLRDHLVKEHIIKGQHPAAGGFLDRLMGKKPEQMG